MNAFPTNKVIHEHLLSSLEHLNFQWSKSRVCTRGSSAGILDKSTGVGCYFLQGDLLNQGSNPGLLHCRQTLYPLSHQGSPLSQLQPARNSQAQNSQTPEARRGRPPGGSAGTHMLASSPCGRPSLRLPSPCRKHLRPAAATLKLRVPALLRTVQQENQGWAIGQVPDQTQALSFPSWLCEFRQVPSLL